MMAQCTLNLQDNIQGTLEEVVEVLNGRLNTNFTFEEIVNSALTSLINKKPYVSLFSALSGRVRFTVDDALKINSLTEEEDDTLEMLLATYYRDKEIRSLANEIASDVASGEVSPYVDNLIDDLYSRLKNEMDIRKRNEVFRNGYKKLLIKTAIISLVRRDNYY